MIVIPCNNRIIVEEKKEEEKETAFFVPEEYSTKEDKFKLYKFIQAGSSCRNEYLEGDEVLVESYLIEEAEIANNKILLVTEAAVVCIIRNERGQKSGD